MTTWQFTSAKASPVWEFTTSPDAWERESRRQARSPRTAPYSVEGALVTKIIEERDLRPVMRGRRGARALFGDEDTREVFDWLVKQWETHGKVPTMNLVREQFPDFEPVDTRDDLAMVVQHAREKRLYVDLQRTVKQIATEARLDVASALEVLKTEAISLGLTYDDGDAIDASQSGKDMKRYYRMLKRKKGMLGVPWPWPLMNKSTKGIRKGQFIALYGPAGTMKTWLLVVIADYLHRVCGVTVVFFSCEMPPEDIQLRWAALRAGVDYERFQDGRLTKSEEKRFNAACDEFQNDPPFVIEALDDAGSGVVGEIQAKAQQCGARVILLDGLISIFGDLEWRPVTQTLKALKAMTNRTRMSLVVTHHANANRKKVKLADNDAQDVALGDELQRRVDVLIRVNRTPQNEESGEVVLRTKKVREGRPVTLTCHALPAVNFGQKFAGDGTTVDEDGEGEDDDGIVA